MSTTELAPMAEGELAESKHATPEQAKIDAVANLTMRAYERAGTLKLTGKEREQLTAEFADEDFRAGAGGKADLIYLEHAAIRDRFNTVIGAGQWAIVPRSRWTENFTTGKGKPGIRIYVEAMLIIRGAFVAEAIGNMDYYPNDQTNYGDAVEGAKSAALRRCAKELGVGLQAWKKTWCDGWWQRKRQPQKPVNNHQDKPQTLQEAMESQMANEVPPRTKAEEHAAIWVARFQETTAKDKYDNWMKHAALAAFRQACANHGFDDLIERIDNAARECEDRVYQTVPA